MINDDKENLPSTHTDQPLLTVPDTSDISHGSNAVAISRSNSSVTKPSIIYFFSLFYTFLCMGFGTGITGSTLLKLGEQTNSTVDQLTSIFFTRSCGFLTGTTLAGFLIDRFSDYGNTFLAIGVLIMSGTTLLIPFIYRLLVLIPVQFAWGFAGGIVENLAQLLTIKNYSHHNIGPYLQALHSAFGIGAFISPLIVAQFISERQKTNQWHYAYFIIFLLHLPDLVWISCYSIYNEWYNTIKSSEPISSQETDEFLSTSPVNIAELNTNTNEKRVKSELLFILLLAPFIFCYVGSEYGFSSYLNTYATLHLRFSKDTAAYLTSTFWASFVIGRLCGIPISMRLSPQIMIFGDLLGCITSFLLLLIFHKVHYVLWIGSILFGLSITSVYSSTIAYAKNHITITGKRLSVLIVTGALGDGSIPLLMGMSIGSTFLGYPIYIILALVIIVMASVLFTINFLCVARSSSSSHASKRVKSRSEKQIESSTEINLKHPEMNISEVIC